jgi:GH15 family glucan-1,4-alpha-glucosidase
MTRPIEDYAFIGNRLSAALVARDGSIDWLCLPRFDSDACFAALLGTEEHGRWLMTPVDPIRSIRRRYRPGTLILETTFETDSGAATLIDFMPLSEHHEYVDLARIVRADRGEVRMRTELKIRFGYGAVVPWIRRTDFGLRAISGPDAIEIHAPVALSSNDRGLTSEFVVGAGTSLPFTLSWHPSHRVPRRRFDTPKRLKETEAWWVDWSSQRQKAVNGSDRWSDAVERSLLTLKGLTYRQTGGIVAAATTSLPEELGGERNWDYRYCWIRDATLTLYALLSSGYRDEAREWREWLLRASAGHPSQLQIMYGLAGERRLTEIELDWLPGYAGSRPVRIGNGAHGQLQLDVYGELMDALHAARRYRLNHSEDGWSFQKVLLEDLAGKWRQPDHGIWEVRGPARHFTHSRLMAWVAFDRAVRSVEEFGLKGPVTEWRTTRDAIRADILANGWSERRQSFVQSYDSDALDASLLLLPLVGFLPAKDPRCVATVRAIQRDLVDNGLVLRYWPEEAEDGLRGGEGAFLATSFWLVDALVMIGETDEAHELFERLLALRNDVGLLAEEYDPRGRRQLGNFPQAFSHVGIVNSAALLNSASGTAPAPPVIPALA